MEYCRVGKSITVGLLILFLNRILLFKVYHLVAYFGFLHIILTKW